MQQLILASASRWRRRMLEDAGLAVVAVPSGVDESTGARDDPVALAEGLAHAKAAAVAGRHPEAVVIGADQVAWEPESRVVWGKPPTPEAHLAMLRAMRGRQHHLVTGYVVMGDDLVQRGHHRTVLSVRADLTDDELRAYVDSGEGSGCAGGYAAEGRGSFLFERIEGDWYNVMGMPLFDILSALRARGWRFTGTAMSPKGGA